MSGPAAGSYDPRRATFAKPVRTSVPNGEPDIATWTDQFQRHIKVMTRSTSEANIQQQSSAFALAVFRVRRDSKTEQIGPEWKLTHKTLGTTCVYGVVGVPAVDYDAGEIELVCRTERKALS